MMLYVDPEDCIDCGACLPECPVGAIFPETEVPVKWTQFVQLNAERASALRANGGPVTQKQEAKKGPGCQGSAGMG
jgi:ferredoxin